MPVSIQPTILNDYKQLPAKRVAFKGIPPHLKAAEQVVSDIKNKGFVSNTLLAFRLEKLSSRAGNEVIKQFSRLKERFNNRILQMRMGFEFEGNYPEFIKDFKESVHRYRAANCGDNAIYCQSELAKKGVFGKKIALVVQDKETNHFLKNSDHCFVVVNMRHDADVENPHTWGKNAIIVDSWLGVAKRARDAIQQFSAEFKLNPKTQRFQFMEDSRYESQIIPIVMDSEKQKLIK